MRSNKLKIALALALVLLPAFAMAQGIVDLRPQPVGLPGDRNATVQTTVTDIITGIFLPVAGIIAVLFIIIGGFQYMFAGTNEKLAERGKNTIRNAVIGLIIIILSYVIIVVVINTIAGASLP
jgi:hypothetical protein